MKLADLINIANMSKSDRKKAIADHPEMLAPVVFWVQRNPNISMDTIIRQAEFQASHKAFGAISNEQAWRDVLAILEH